MSLKTERDLTPTARNNVNRAKTAIQAKNIDYAISLLQAALVEEPLYLEGRKVLRQIEIQKFKSQGALARQMAGMRLSGSLIKLGASKKTPQEQLVHAEEILATDPFNHKANTTMGDAGMTLGHPEFRCFAFETVVSGKADTDKSKIKDLHSLAQAYMDAKEFDSAVKTYDRIIAINPADGDALSGLKNASAAHASKVGKWEDAKDYRDLIKDKAVAEQLERDSKVVKSSDAIEDQIAFNYQKYEAEPNNPNPPKMLGQLYAQQGDLERSIGWYKYAYDVGGKTDSSLDKIIGDLELKRVEGELQKLRADHAAQVDPELKQQALIGIEEKEKELNEIRLVLAEARVKAQPNEGEFRYELGEALFKLGQHKRAVEELQLALRAPAVRHQALNLMGQAFAKRNMFDFAIKRLMEAESEMIEMNDLKKEVVYNLGLVYEQTKQTEKALEQWKKIYEVDMGYRDVAARVEASYGSGEE